MAKNRLSPIESFLAGDESISLPFKLMINDKCYSCQQILRLLPGKRLVVKAEAADGQLLLIKLFANQQKGRRELQRELAGYQLLQQSKVTIAALVFSDEQASDYSVIAYQYLADAQLLSQQTEYINVYTKALFELTANLHQQGIYQADFHLDNILLVDGELVLIDLASVKKQSDSADLGLSRQASLANLALLIAQFQAKQQQLLVAQLDYYYTLRDWDFDAEQQQQFNTVLDQVWQKRKTNHLNKCFRACTMTAYSKTFSRQYAMQADFFKLVGHDFIEQIDDLVKQGQLLKAGNSATVVKINYAGKDLVVKRYNIKSVTHFLSRCFRSSRAANSWRNANLLDLIGINTPSALGFIEHRVAGLRTKAYLICEYSEGQEIASVFTQRAANEDEISQLKTLFSLLQQYRISHGDLKATNLLVDKQGQIELIDLDSMREHNTASSFHSAFNKDKQRFILNWSNAKINDVFINEGLF